MAEAKRGGHDLTWDGGTFGIIKCSTCTRAWEYSTPHWKHTIPQRCAGSPAAEEAKRDQIQAVLATEQPASAHRLSFDRPSNRVRCSVCLQYVAATVLVGNWKGFVRQRECTPAAPGETPESIRFTAKNGKRKARSIPVEGPRQGRRCKAATVIRQIKHTEQVGSSTAAPLEQARRTSSHPALPRRTGGRSAPWAPD